MDILVEKGMISRIAPRIEGADVRVLDASGRYVSPGWLDLHVHLREPGREDEETIASGRRGRPGRRLHLHLLHAQHRTGHGYSFRSGGGDGEVGAGEGADVFPIGAVSRARQGRELAELAGMHASSGRVRAFSDDGNGVQDAGLMRRALEYVKMFDGVIVSHCEEAGLAAGGRCGKEPDPSPWVCAAGRPWRKR